MPWLTPDDIPEADDCRPLSIPANSVWLALVSGALTELTLPYNWEKFGTLTVAETVEKMQSIVDNYYNSPCGACTTPGGYRVIRISGTGHVEQLDESGNWVDGTGEYHIPLPDAREGGTEQDQICLAATNAVYVLEQLYENLTDSWNSELDEAEAETAFILGLIALVGFEFAPITWGIVAFMTAVFAALYTTLEFIGADLWDTSVSDQITCFLTECATNTAGVVTFDYQCFMNRLNSLTDTFSLTETQLRLYLQIGYMLYFIGGMDGLNLAGGTTAISVGDCDLCSEHCFRIDLKEIDGNSYGVVISGGTWVDGSGIQGHDYGSNARSDAYGFWEFPETLNVTTLRITYTKTAGSGSNNVNHFNALNPATNYTTTVVQSDATNALGTSLTKEMTHNDDLAGMGWDINSGTSSTPLFIEALEVSYMGHIPDGWSDNCG